MNNRIKELIEQAEIKFESHPQHQGVDTAVIIPTDLEKFAELIVQECINVLPEKVKIDDLYDGKILVQCGIAIKQHFGVKE